MTTLTFELYHRGELLTVQATLRDLNLGLPEGLVVSVHDVTSGTPERLPGPRPEGKLSAAEHAAFEAAHEICARVSLYLPPSGVPGPPVSRLLKIAAERWSQDQQERYSADHPTGRSDAQQHREEAPYGSER